MKLRKKLVTLALSLSLVLGTSVTAFAAPNDDVIQALKDAKIPQSYITQAENYLKTTTLTAAQATAVQAQVTKAADVMKAVNVTDATKLTDSQLQTVLTAVKDAGTAINLNITVAKESNGSVSIVAKDTAGNTVVTFSTTDVKQTGANNTIFIAGILFIVLAAGSVIAVRKVTA